MLADNRFLSPFLRRSLLPVLFLLLGLLIVSNFFLLATRPTVRLPGQSDQLTTGNDYPPLAFGEVVRPFAPASKFHQLATPAVYSYVAANDLIPAIPPQMNLYRDQGIVLDNTVFDRLLRSVGVQAGDQLHLLPVSVGFETPDGANTVSVDVARRELTVQPKSQTAVPVDGSVAPPTDGEMIGTARTFALQFGMKPDAYDAPTVVRGSGSAVQSKLPAGMAEVRWPMKADAYPVYDQYGKPVIGMSAVVNAKTGIAAQLTVRLLAPSLLAASPYPTSPVSTLFADVSGGGLTPIRSTPGKATVNVQYKDAKLAYVLWEGDGSLPTYMIPAVVLEADVPLNCGTGCEPWHWTSYIPVLDPTEFSWPAPAAGSGVTVTTSSSSKAKTK